MLIFTDHHQKQKRKPRRKNYQPKYEPEGHTEPLPTPPPGNYFREIGATFPRNPRNSMRKSAVSTNKTDYGKSFICFKKFYVSYFIPVL